MEKMNVNFDNSEYIVLGLKDKKGNFYLYDKSLNKTTITRIKMNESAVSVFSVFPFNLFTSLDDVKTKGYERVYLKIRLVDKLTARQKHEMRSNALMYYRFGNKEMVLLGEFNTPFQYALEMFHKRPKHLGTYNLTTWLIHEEAKSDKEFDVMTEILDIALNRKKSKRVSVDLSLDKYVLKYIKHLVSNENKRKITFGWSGIVRINKEDVIKAEKDGDLGTEELLFIMDRLNLKTPFFYHSKFTTEFLMKYLNSSNENARKVEYLDKVGVQTLHQVGINMDKVFSFHYQLFFKDLEHDEDGTYTSLEDLVADANYEPRTEISDPYNDYYCCSDCDGYELEYDESDYYEYEVDDQVDMLQGLIKFWSDYLTADSAYLFAGWSNDIFRRYIKEYGEDKFVRSLIK